MHVLELPLLLPVPLLPAAHPHEDVLLRIEGLVKGRGNMVGHIFQTGYGPGIMASEPTFKPRTIRRGLGTDLCLLAYRYYM